MQCRESRRRWYIMEVYICMLVESLQSHCIHTMCHWSSGLPVCFPSQRTRVQNPRGVLVWNRDSPVSVVSLHAASSTSLLIPPLPPPPTPKTTSLHWMISCGCTPLTPPTSGKYTAAPRCIAGQADLRGAAVIWLLLQQLGGGGAETEEATHIHIHIHTHRFSSGTGGGRVET
jgi:hypothetical protein